MSLCWKCKEYWRKLFDKGSWPSTNPSLHCHHDEPEEKPKEKCWCEETSNPKHCPICGKLLNA